MAHTTILSCLSVLISDVEAMKARLKTIQSGTTDLAALSSPLEMRALPFPQSFPPLPTDCFRIKADGTFDYMGREAFAPILHKWKSLRQARVFMLNVYGTPGYVEPRLLHHTCTVSRCQELPSSVG